MDVLDVGPPEDDVVIDLIAGGDAFFFPPFSAKGPNILQGHSGFLGIDRVENAFIADFTL